MEREQQKSSRPKSRQSLAHPPSSTNNSKVDKENATADIAALQRRQDALQQKKKLRGKSLGPGGLEALIETSGNAVKDHSLQLKSILKPTVPLTPPKVIPSFDELRKRSTGKTKSPKHATEELLIDFSTPAANRDQSNVTMTGAETVADPFSPSKAGQSGDEEVKEDSEEAQQEAELKRQAAKQAILDRRAARRKSMANRRVSFAPEATLHTWSVMELAEDSTTSSASNSTRRQSSMTAQQSPQRPSSSPGVTQSSTDRPTTPPEQSDEPQTVASPAHQRDLHQKKRRRSSTGPQTRLEGAEEDTLSSSPSGDLRTDSSPVRIDDTVGSSSDDDEEEGDTSMSVDESTSQSVGSGSSEASTQSSLDERLRQAASQAGTRGIEYDEHGDDLSMEMATQTVTHAFQPWVKNNQGGHLDSALDDQENVNPFLPAVKARQVQNPETEGEDADRQDDTQEMSMDVTKAVGGILAGSSPAKNRRKSVANRRRSSVGRRRSSGGESANGDETMDFTTVGGRILGRSNEEPDEDMSEADMTMDFTAAVGGVVGRANRRESTQSAQSDENETMDMTAAVGGILPPIEEQTEPQTDVEDNHTTGMEMTNAVGGIFRQQTTPHTKTQAKVLMQEETDAGQLSVSPGVEKFDQSTASRARTPSQGPVTSIASESGSPDVTLKPRLSGRSRQGPSVVSTTPRFSPKRITPARSPVKGLQVQSTPTKQLTPRPTKPDTPNKTPILSNVVHRGASPKKLFKEELKARASPANPDPKPSPRLFASDANTGQQTPSVILKATRPKIQRRRSSGVGIDQEGYGSPAVAQLLDRRTSIGEAASTFSFDGKQKALRFEDPQEMEREEDAERAEQERRESGRFIMEQEANEQQDENATLQLKEMIESMSPKKQKSSRMKGRKSLAVGAAKGLLGKRPAELDLEDDEDNNSTPKRLKLVEKESSPVKNIHLPKPPSKEETTGRLSRIEQNNLTAVSAPGTATPAVQLSPIQTTASSPHHTGHFRDVSQDASAHRPESFEEKLDNVVGAVDASIVEHEELDKDEAKISLQDFLNMTNVHFIELSTTKRRPTMAQITPKRPSEEAMERSTKANFIAAATTLPLLELYQHATRELKTYISTGRKIIRSIEAETLAEQPALFREYIDARPDVKSVMDNQFRNGKTNARLQSKEGWYTWRAQLVDGLKTGLEGIKQGMEDDAVLLTEQQSNLEIVVPGLQQQKQNLESELEGLQQTLTELDSVDNDVLNESRRQLRSADELHAEQTTLLDQLRQQMAEKEEALYSAAELKEEMQGQIEEADRVKQEYRGWPVADVVSLKAKVDTIEQETGWRLLAAEEDDDSTEFGVALTLMFKNELRLFFYPSVYQLNPGNGGRRRSGRRSRSVSGPTAPISVSYTPGQDENVATPELPTEKRFFLQLIRSQLQAFSMMPKGSVASRTLLDTVSQGWQLATKVADEIRLLNIAGLTTTSIQSDEKLGVKVMLIISQKSRIDIEFTLSTSMLNDGNISTTHNVVAHGIYGLESLHLTGAKSRKVQQALTKEVESKDIGNGSWIGAIHAFEQWLQGQTRSKSEQPKQQVPQEHEIPEMSTEPPPPAKEIRRSPLAPKRANAIQKKALPVPTAKHRAPTQPMMASIVARAVSAEADKENMPAITAVSADIVEAKMVSTPVKTVQEEWQTPDMGQPAIPPEMQEQWLRGVSPRKRMGALRRSPV